MDSNDSSAGVKPRRAYRSARRQALAEATRRRILGAARRLFVERGYGGTGVEALAEPAPALRLRHVARIHRDFVERYWDVFEALRTAAASAPEVAAAWRAAAAHRLRD